jgi:hypothetical protein
MTRAKSLAHRILDRFQTDEVEDLGLFAARTEVHAEERGLNPWERQALLNRADHYRDLQVAALAKF